MPIALFGTAAVSLEVSSVAFDASISPETYVDIQKVARDTIEKIGYNDADLGFSCGSCAVISAIDKQSADIAQGVDVSHATRPVGSSRMTASRTPSEIWSAILSGWPSVTDSEVNRYSLSA